ncbi:MAG: helix-turn-helix transcriptional regulator [Dehalobacterium sp.]
MRKVLKDIRKKKGYSVDYMANSLNVSKSFYYKIESGLRNPTMETAKKIADILTCTVDQLFFVHHLDKTSKKRAQAS